MERENKFIQDSLELNLFYLRIMKEHALFLQLGFTPKNKQLATEADSLKKRLTALLSQTAKLSKGYISDMVMASGELVTQYTEEAERQTQFFTGVPVDTALTREEYSLGGGAVPPVSLRPKVEKINRDALALTTELLRYKQRVLADVLACRIFTVNYPLQIDHIIREAQDYIQLLQLLMAGDLDMTPEEFAGMQEFWNNNMGEHAEFIAGMLDPTEKALILEASDFATEFDMLQQQAESAESMLQMLPEVTAQSATATESIREFKAQGTKGILSCSVRSIIIPLLSDHVLREANYYLRILKQNM